MNVLFATKTLLRQAGLCGLVGLVSACSATSDLESTGTLEEPVLRGTAACRVSTLVASATPTSIANASEPMIAPSMNGLPPRRLQVVSGDPSNFTATLVFGPTDHSCTYAASGNPPILTVTGCAGASTSAAVSFTSLALNLQRINPGVAGSVQVRSTIDNLSASNGPTCPGEPTVSWLLACGALRISGAAKAPCSHQCSSTRGMGFTA